MKKGIYDGLKGVFKMLIEDNKPIRFFNRLKQTFSLFISRQKFYFQRQLHAANIRNIFLYQKIIINFVKQFNYGAAIPPIHAKGDEWVSLPKYL